MTLAWFVVFAIVGVTICMCNILFPRKMWGLFKAWRFKNPETVEPSDLVLRLNRTSSVLGIILLVVLGVVLFMDSRENARCEKLLPELERLYEAGGVPAVERRARELGLEVEDGTLPARYSTPVGTIKITDHGKPFATIDATYSSAYCQT